MKNEVKLSDLLKGIPFDGKNITDPYGDVDINDKSIGWRIAYLLQDCIPIIAIATNT